MANGNKKRGAADNDDDDGIVMPTVDDNRQPSKVRRVSSGRGPTKQDGTNYYNSDASDQEEDDEEEVTQRDDEEIEDNDDDDTAAVVEDGEDNANGSPRGGVEVLGKSVVETIMAEREGFLSQERAIGNVIDYEDERAKVKAYAKKKIFNVCPFPGSIGFRFSVCYKDMPDKEKYKVEGLVCRMVLAKFGKHLQKKEEWWSRVVGEARNGISRRRSQITEATKAIHSSKYYPGEG